MPTATETYKGQVAYTSGDGTNPTAIVVDTTTNAPLAQSFVDFSWTVTDEAGLERALRHLFTAKLSVNGSNLELKFSRNDTSTSETVTIEWTVTVVASASLEQDIQRGEVSASNATEHISITAVDADASFFLTSVKTDQLGYMGAPPRYTAALTTSITASDRLTLTFTTTPGTNDGTVAWQVIELKTADISCQHGTTSFTKSGTATISAVTLVNALVLQTGSTGGNLTPTRYCARVKMNSTIELGFNAQNYGSGVSQDVSWSVLEMLDGTRVEKGEVAIADSSASPATAPSFTAVALDRSQPLIGYWLPNAYKTVTGDDGLDSVANRQVLNGAGTEILITRADTVHDIEVGWNVVEWKAAGGGGQTVTPSAVGSLEAFGSALVGPGSVSLLPSAIASGESHGSTLVSPGAVTILPSGLVSLEAFGGATVSAGAVVLSPAGLVSQEAHGATVVSADGGPQTVTPTGVSSGESHGSTLVSPGAVTINPSAILTSEAFGSPQLSFVITPTSIASAEALGTALVTPGGVSVIVSAIASLEAFGGAVVTNGGVLIAPSAIASAEQHGTAALVPGGVTILPNGIISTEIFGGPLVSAGTFGILPSAIGSLEAFGDHTLALGGVLVAPNGVDSLEAFGGATVALQLQILTPTGIASLEAFGTPVVLTGAGIQALRVVDALQRTFIFGAHQRLFVVDVTKH